MKKTEAVFATIIITTVFYGWIGYSMSQSYLKDIGSLRGSIIEARKLLNSPIENLDKEASHASWLDSTISKKTLLDTKKEIEDAQIILENAQNSLEWRGED